MKNATGESYRRAEGVLLGAHKALRQPTPMLERTPQAARRCLDPSTLPWSWVAFLLVLT